MDEPHSGSTKIGLLLSKLNTAMSEAEAIESCKIYFIISSSKKINNLLILEIKSKQNKTEQSEIDLIKIWLNRLALTKEAYIIIGSIKNSPELEPDFTINSKLAKDMSKGRQNPTFKISTRNAITSEGKKEPGQTDSGKDETSPHPLRMKELAALLSVRGFHKTDMHKPDFDFVILNCNTQIIGIRIWTNSDMFERRKAHLRPVLHPTAINPRLARAMINMVGAKKEVLDPFCGTGGLLLEAANINLQAFGTDINHSMIARAKTNLQNESPQIKDLLHIKQMDAMNWNQKVECVATDLPYGKSSQLDTSISELIQKFLLHYEPLTDKIAFCFPKGTEVTVPECWKVKFFFEIYIHKSLTRNILVIEK